MDYLLKVKQLCTSFGVFEENLLEKTLKEAFDETQLRDIVHRKRNYINSPIYMKSWPRKDNVLFSAIFLKDYELINYLMYKKAYTELVSQKMTFLVLAITRDEFEVVKKLHQSGAEINSIIQSTGKSPLMMALEKVNYEIAEYFIEQGVDVNAVNKSKDDWRPLHYACRHQINVEMIKLLLDNNADIDAKTTNNSTAIKFAVLAGDYEKAMLLIVRGADIYYTDISGRKSIIYDTLGHVQRKECLEYLLNSDEPRIDLIILHEKQNLLRNGFDRYDISDLLLDAGGIDVNSEESAKLIIECLNPKYRGYSSYEAIKWHIVKLVAAGAPVCERYLQAMEPIFEDLTDLYKYEVEEMKSLRIGVSKVTFLDGLRMSIQGLAVRLKTTGLGEVIPVDKEILCRRFPQYGGMFFYKLSKVERRIKYLKKLEYSVEEVLCNWGLPYNFVRELWSYFTNRDLMKLINVIYEEVEPALGTSMAKCKIN